MFVLLSHINDYYESTKFLGAFATKQDAEEKLQEIVDSGDGCRFVSEFVEIPEDELKCLQGDFEQSNYKRIVQCYVQKYNGFCSDHKYFVLLEC